MVLCWLNFRNAYYNQLNGYNYQAGDIDVAKYVTRTQQDSMTINTKIVCSSITHNRIL